MACESESLVVVSSDTWDGAGTEQAGEGANDDENQLGQHPGAKAIGPGREAVACGRASSGDDPFQGFESTCAAYHQWPSADQARDGVESGEGIVIHVHNDGEKPLILPNYRLGCGEQSRYFMVEGRAGPRELRAPRPVDPLQWSACDCHHVESTDLGQSCGAVSCESYVTGLAIAPGAALTLLWDAVVVAETVMPGECSRGGHGDSACRVGLRAPVGSYSIWSEAGVVGEAPCTFGDAGWCIVEDSGWESDVRVWYLVSDAWDGQCGQSSLVFR